MQTNSVAVSVKDQHEKFVQPFYRLEVDYASDVEGEDTDGLYDTDLYDLYDNSGALTPQQLIDIDTELEQFPQSVTFKQIPDDEDLVLLEQMLRRVLGEYSQEEESYDYDSTVHVAYDSDSEGSCAADQYFEAHWELLLEYHYDQQGLQINKRHSCSAPASSN